MRSLLIAIGIFLILVSGFCGFLVYRSIQSRAEDRAKAVRPPQSVTTIFGHGIEDNRPIKVERRQWHTFSWVETEKWVNDYAFDGVHHGRGLDSEEAAKAILLPPGEGVRIMIPDNFDWRKNNFGEFESSGILNHWYKNEVPFEFWQNDKPLKMALMVIENEYLKFNGKSIYLAQEWREVAEIEPSEKELLSALNESKLCKDVLLIVIDTEIWNNGPSDPFVRIGGPPDYFFGILRARGLCTHYFLEGTDH